MIAPNIDIPPGLEEAYAGIVRVLGGVNPDTIILKKGSPARKNYSIVGSRSLFVKWQDLYNSLSDSRHLAWTSYWLTLPFGSHGGLHGYPGSGFSAFVYFNAPRYQLGLDPLLDPPASSNLWPNGDFHLGDVGWNYNSAFAIFSLRLNCVPGEGGGDALISDADYDADLLHGHSYRFEFDFSISAGVVSYFLYNHENAQIITSGDLAHTTAHFSYDFTLGEFDREDGWTPFIEISDDAEGWLTNFSLIEL